MKTFWKIVRSYFYRPASNKQIEIRVANQIFAAKTDTDGEFELQIEIAEIDQVEFRDADTGELLVVLSDSKALFKVSDTNLFVISDIDDTILVSHSASFFSKLWLMLFKPVDKRKTVEESEMAYRELKKSGMPFAYVSASEYNLYSLISTFIKFHKLPEGPIYLRPHQQWHELICPTHRLDYKLDRITKLMKNFKTKRFVLFGDDSQQDFTVFGEIALLFPERVHSVYLRKTGSLKANKARKAIWEMPGGKIPVHYYDSYSEIETEIKKLMDEVSGRN